MSASRRRKKDQPQPEDQGFDELEPVEESEELDTLELVEDEDDLDELEPIDDDADDSPVRVTCEDAAEDGVDTVLAVHVPEMAKQAVVGAVEAPLRRALGSYESRVRHHRVVVRFDGEALIGTAVKDLCKELLTEAKVLRGVVRRGYGDERVAEGRLPTVSVAVRSVGNAVHVDIGGDVEPADLPMALAPELQKLARDAAGKRFAFSFTGVAPTRAVRDQLTAALTAGSAEAARVGDRLLFDRDLERRVTITRSGDSVDVLVKDAADAEKALLALEMVLAAADFSGQQVAVKVEGGPASPAVIDRLVELCVASKPQQLALDTGSGEDIVWPPLLQVAAKDGRSALRVREGGRSRTGVLAAFRREVRKLEDALEGTSLTIDWPAGFAIDDDVERSCLREALVPLGVASIACTFGGEDREPFVPAPVTVTGKGGVQVIAIDTDAGKPPELMRAIDRRVRTVVSQLRGQPVQVDIRGGGATSRSMMRSLCEIVMSAEATRLEVAQHGKVDVLLPVLLQIAVEGGQVCVAAAAGGRDDEQVEVSLARELDGVDIAADADVVVAPGPLAEQVAAAVIARGAARVSIGDHQVYPEVPSPLVHEGDRLAIDLTGLDAAWVADEMPGLLDGVGDLAAVDVTVLAPGSGPAGEPAATVHSLLVARGARLVLHDDGGGKPHQVHPEVVRDYVTVLGRNDATTPPLTMLGIEGGDAADHEAKVLDKLAGLGELIDGRRVLVVLRDGERDCPLRRSEPLIDAVRRVVEPRAAATLVFRGADAAGRPFFQVTASGVEGLAVGARVGDPRA